MKTIEIFIAPSGAARVETEGFQGSQCQAASRFLEEALGETTTRQHKPEFFLPEATSLPQRQSG